MYEGEDKLKVGY